MSLDQEHRLEEIFSAARDLPPLERAAFLEQACGGDAELRRQAGANRRLSEPLHLAVIQ
jgi:hypothetical protein